MMKTPSKVGSTTLLLVTGGRSPYVSLTLWSLWVSTRGFMFDQAVVVDNDLPSTDRRYPVVSRLAREVVIQRLPGASLRESVLAGWRACSCEFIFHLEDDFLFHRRVDIPAMQRDLVAPFDGPEAPRPSQRALLRQRWYDHDYPHPCYRDWLLSEHDHVVVNAGAVIMGCWTFNPAVYRRSLADAISRDVADADPALNFERVVEDYVGTHNLGMLVDSVRRPQVWHIGAVTTAQLRGARSERRRRISSLYARKHAGRAFRYFRHLCSALIGCWGDERSKHRARG